MTFVVEQDVLWLQVPVDDGVRVEALDGQDDLRCVEAGALFGEPALGFQVVEELASVQEIQDEVEFLGRLKRVM